MVKTLDVVIPAYRGNINEFEFGFIKQYDYYKSNLNEFKWNVLISLNGDRAEKIIEKAKKFCKKYSNVSYIHTLNEGKGYSIVNGLKNCKSDIVAYMDVDLSTDLSSFRNLISGIVKGYDISNGSRYHKNSIVERYHSRRILSMIYHMFILRFFLNVKFRDAQCGYKAVSQRFIKEVLPLVKDRNWFFETEMLYLAEKKGLKIIEIPIVWKESGFSSVRLIKTVLEFLSKVIELKFRKLNVN